MFPGAIAGTSATGYGLLLIVALLTCWWLARHRAQAFGVEPSHVDLIVPVIFLLASLGARGLSAVSPGDLAIGSAGESAASRFRLFGLVFLGAPLLLVYCRLARISFRRTADLLAVPTLAWLAVLRVGCFLAGCCWGDVTVRLDDLDPGEAARLQTIPWLTGDWIPSVTFPQGSHAFLQQAALGLAEPAAGRSLPVHATQIYELALLIPLALAIDRFSHRKPAEGARALFALIGYAALRFLVEFIRADSDLLIAGLTLTQVICVAVLAIGMAAPAISRLAPGFPARTRTSS